ncbi:hypothetical protein SNEBB_009510 [Seison nebaliae]|nr:hypothetical protein SNEBB_009510 [Seison nebaliae]
MKHFHQLINLFGFIILSTSLLNETTKYEIDEKLNFVFLQISPIDMIIERSENDEKKDKIEEIEVPHTMVIEDSSSIEAFDEWRRERENRKKHEEFELNNLNSNVQENEERLKKLEEIRRWKKKLHSIVEEKKNYALIKCGASIKSSSSKHSNAILTESLDDYLLSPCKDLPIYVVVELCEMIHLTHIVLGNLELFSNNPKTFLLYVSERANPKDWTQRLIAKFYGANRREQQIFSLYDMKKVEKIQVDVKSKKRTDNGDLNENGKNDENNSEIKENFQNLNNSQNEKRNSSPNENSDGNKNEDGNGENGNGSNDFPKDQNDELANNGDDERTKSAIEQNNEMVENVILSSYLYSDTYVKYIRLEIMDSHGEEHYCPLSILSVYGDDRSVNSEPEDSSDDDDTEQIINSTTTIDILTSSTNPTTTSTITPIIHNGNNEKKIDENGREKLDNEDKNDLNNETNGEKMLINEDKIISSETKSDIDNDLKLNDETTIPQNKSKTTILSEETTKIIGKIKKYFSSYNSMTFRRQQNELSKNDFLQFLMALYILNSSSSPENLMNLKKYWSEDELNEMKRDIDSIDYSSYETSLLHLMKEEYDVNSISLQQLQLYSMYEQRFHMNGCHGNYSTINHHQSIFHILLQYSLRQNGTIFSPQFFDQHFVKRYFYILFKFDLSIDMIEIDNWLTFLSLLSSISKPISMTTTSSSQVNISQLIHNDSDSKFNIETYRKLQRISKNLSIEQKNNSSLGIDSKVKNENNDPSSSSSCSTSSQLNMHSFNQSLWKDFVNLKIGNTIKNIEYNLSLTNIYLQQLSKHYTSKIELMNKNFNRTMNAVIDCGRNCEEKHRLCLINVTKLEKKLNKVQIDQKKNSKVIFPPNLNNICFKSENFILELFEKRWHTYETSLRLSIEIEYLQYFLYFFLFSLPILMSFFSIYHRYYQWQMKKYLNKQISLHTNQYSSYGKLLEETVKHKNMDEIIKLKKFLIEIVAHL